jgi:NDP-sugar pyrophosphorylase family protein
VVIKKGAKIGAGSLISFGVVIKEGAVIAPGSMISRYSFNSDTLKFEKVTKFDEEYFENAVIAYIPRECQLQPCELLGAGNIYHGEEDSDFDDEGEEEDDNDRE